MQQCNTGLAYNEWRFDEAKTQGDGSLHASPAGRFSAAANDKTDQAFADPMFLMLSVLAGPWTLYLAWILLRDGPKRFSELRRLVPGISSKVLTERLRLLEAERYLVRQFQKSDTTKVTYEATPRLQELAPILFSMSELARNWHSNPAAKGTEQGLAAAGQS